MTKPKTYIIKAVHDFFKVPIERRSDCLREFEMAMALGGLAHDVGFDVFHWTDDGDRSVTLVNPADEKPYLTLAIKKKSMNQSALHIILTDPEQAKSALSSQLVPYCREVWERGGKVALRAQDHEDEKTIKQRAYYHRCVLQEIADSAEPMGVKHDMKVWKEYAREKFLGFKWVIMLDPLTGKKHRRKVRISTEDLGVRAYSKLIDQVSAWGATEFGVVYSVPNWQSWQV